MHGGRLPAVSLVQLVCAAAEALGGMHSTHSVGQPSGWTSQDLEAWASLSSGAVHPSAGAAPVVTMPELAPAQTGAYGGAPLPRVLPGLGAAAAALPRRALLLCPTPPPGSPAATLVALCAYAAGHLSMPPACPHEQPGRAAVRVACTQPS